MPAVACSVYGVSILAANRLTLGGSDPAARAVVGIRVSRILNDDLSNLRSCFHVVQRPVQDCVVIHTVTAAKDGSPASPRIDGDSDARRYIVLILGGADGVFIIPSHAEIERDVGQRLPLILNEQGVEPTVQITGRLTDESDVLNRIRRSVGRIERPVAPSAGEPPDAVGSAEPEQASIDQADVEPRLQRVIAEPVGCQPREGVDDLPPILRLRPRDNRRLPRRIPWRFSAAQPAQ